MPSAMGSSEGRIHEGVALDAWAGAETVDVTAGAELTHEGERSDDVFQVVSGTFEVLRGPRSSRIDVVGPGTLLGDIAALTGTPRRATIRALEPAVVRRIDRASYQRWMAADERRLDDLSDLARLRIDRHAAISLVSGLLGVDDAVAAEVVALASWVRLAAGEALFEQGDVSDAGYLLVTGRLGVARNGDAVGEVSRGEVVGELGVLEAAPRSATVIALRDSSLARFEPDAFRTLAAAHPDLMLHVVRTIVARSRRPDARRDRARSIAVAVVADVDGGGELAATIASELALHGTSRHLAATDIGVDLGPSGPLEAGAMSTTPVVLEHIHETETHHDYLVLDIAANDPLVWTRTALTVADRVVVIMSADPAPDEVRRAERVLAACPRRSQLERWLALLQPAAVDHPRGSGPLADRLGFDRVAHIANGSDADVRRLARIVSGNGTGLVLGGGGARGFAHLGVWRALGELGIDVDVIGGTSIGAPLGAGMARRIVPDDFVPLATEMFHDLLDYTVPVVSLVKGARIARNIAAQYGGLDVRDLWLPFFCVSTNLTRSRVEVHSRGDLATAVRASVAIPGILPPVAVDGDLLIDGGVLNNLPCDVMRASQMVRTLIAVDLSPSVGPAAVNDFGPSLSGWKALRSQVGSRRSKLPGVMSIVMRAMVVGSVRDRDQLIADGTVDCYLDLELPGVRLLDFERVAEITARGYHAARPRLAAWLATR
jgi:predicted acylesterase/phospholipase RssA/CRP-like cAMP-binding protein